MGAWGMEQTSVTVTNPTMSKSGVPSRRLVIADDGHSAAIFHLDSPLVSLGSQFQWAGSRWKIVAYRSHAKAFVAQPIEH